MIIKFLTFFLFVMWGIIRIFLFLIILNIGIGKNTQARVNFVTIVLKINLNLVLNKTQKKFTSILLFLT